MRFAFAFLLVVSACVPLPADAFPERPVHLVVPFGAGGSADVVARLLSVRLAGSWKQPVTVQNLPGAASVYGTHAVAKAAPDGHTLLVGSAALVINEALSRKLPYHALRDFTPITLAASQHVALVVHDGSPISSVKALIQAAKAKPAQLTYGSSGEGTVGHLAGELFRLMTLTNLNHIAYLGTRETIAELGEQHVSSAMLALPPVMPHLKSGQLRVLAVTSRRRAAALPNVPTIGETIPGYEVTHWIGLFAPYGVSVSLVRTLNADVTSIVSSPDFSAKLGSLGYEAIASTSGQLQTRMATEIDRYSRIGAAAGIEFLGRTNRHADRSGVPRND